MDCASSSPLTLDALCELRLLTDRRGLSGESVRAVIEAIDWSRLTRLRSLNIRVGGLELAERKIRAVSPELLARLDFDPESSGTGIMAAARKDIEAALRILAIDDA